MKKILLISLLYLAAFASCNKDREFPDYEDQTVYFAYQYPVRTITLGEDLTANNELDNAYKCQIYAALGGAYYSKKDVSIDVKVDPSLLGNGMLFSAGGDTVLPLPDKYFSLASNTITIPKGALSGGVDVQLNDNFFSDPRAIKNTFVIPLRMTGVTNADSILAGKNYILYALKYVNPWHGNYLRRGKDVITGSVEQTITRHQYFVEDDEVNKLSTQSLTELLFPLVFKDKDGNNVYCTLQLAFSEDGNCAIYSATPGVTATGSGSFVKDGEKKSWGNKDRDALYLNYNISLNDMQVSTADTLVMRDRAVTMETFVPVNQ